MAPRPRSAVVLRLKKTTLQGMLPLPVVHLKDINHDRGFALMQDLTPTLAPDWRKYHQTVLYPSSRYHPVPYYSPLRTGAVGDTSERLLDTARCVLLAAAEAVLAAGAGATADSRAAADDLLLPQRFDQFSALLYGAANGTLPDHVDNLGRYLVLLSLGCSVAFFIDGTVITFESGDALVFNSGPSHGVMHGVRRMQPGTCPDCLSRELHDARISLLLRQL
jgi:hypothetical protein